MESETAGSNQMFAVVSRLLPVVGPVLLISVGYIDPGKWSAVVDGGARFGYDLVLLMLIFNFVAVLCHYLAAAIGVVTGKNLAQICSEEYNKCTCIFLGVLAELSVAVMDLSMVLGIAHGFNLLSGVNMVTCILFTISDTVLFPIFSIFLEKFKAEVFLVRTSGLALLCYVLGVLISQREIPLVMNGLPTKLSGESLFSLMSLLGASIMPHNFYLHSSLVQKGIANASKNALCHDHFLAILCVFSGISLVNYAMMNSAATVFLSDGQVVLTFQDIMDQIIRNPFAIFVLFVLQFVSSQITALTWKVGGQVVLHDFFKMDPPVWLHRLTIRTLVIVVALYSTWDSASDWIYQLLIFSQVVLAMLLPSSVILLIRVASSRSIMGIHKIPQSVEFLAFATLIGMIGLNIVFTTEMLFGNSDWVSNLKLSMGSTMTLPYVVLLIISCASLSLMLWLAATPLKSASVREDSQIGSWDSKRYLLEASTQKKEDDSSKTQYEGEESVVEEPALEKSKSAGIYSDNSTAKFGFDLPETIKDSDQEAPHLPSVAEDITESQSSQTSHLEGMASTIESASVAVEDKEVADVGVLDDVDSLRNIESVDPVGNTSSIEVESQAEKDDDEADSWESEESRGASRSGPTLTAEGPGSFRSISGKSDEGGNGNGSLSRLSGLGRAARRQLAAILDDFWGQLYDFHGQATPEAKLKSFDLLCGLDPKSTTVKAKVNAVGPGSSSYFPSLSETGSALLGNSNSYDSPKQHRVPTAAESPYGYHAGSSLWSNRMQYRDGYLQGSSLSGVPDSGERRYSSLRLPTSSEGLDYQPTTIHGYQLASYLSRIATDRNADARNTFLDSPTPNSQSSAFVPTNYRDTVSHALGQDLQTRTTPVHSSATHNPVISRSRGLQVERPYYDRSSSGHGESFNSSANTKKYHSLPDISGLTVPHQNPYLAENRSSQWKGPPGFEPAGFKVSYEKSHYSTVGTRGQTLLVFDELPPSKLYRDSLTTQSSPNSDTKSLWSRQPFEQLFGVAGSNTTMGDGGSESEIIPPLPKNRVDPETELLQSFRCCILRILKLEGCEWLFRLNGGADEDLIDRVAARERFAYETDCRDLTPVGHIYDSQFLSLDKKSSASLRNQDAGLLRFSSSVPYCGQGCVWQTSIIVSFGVWCIHRILELSHMESRPELWGKYTYVLNRLQGILDPAFSKPRSPLPPCFCLQIPATASPAKRCSPALSNGLLPPAAKPGKGKCTSASTLLDLIREVENAVSCRKGRTGTAAGEVAFPKGKENLASVLKRYKRRLSNKSVGPHDNSGSGPRKVSSLTSYNS